MRDKLSSILQNIEFISLTSDYWTASATESFLAVTVYFIYQNELKTVVLGTRKIECSHTAVNLAESIENVLKSYDIPKEKIVCMTTDNAANMKSVCTVGIPHLG